MTKEPLTLARIVASAQAEFRKHFDERLTEIGWQVMDDLLSMETR